MNKPKAGNLQELTSTYMKIIQEQTNEINMKNKKIAELSEQNNNLQKELQKQQQKILELTNNNTELRLQFESSKNQMEQQKRELKKQKSIHSPIQIPMDSDQFYLQSELIQGISVKISNLELENWARSVKVDQLTLSSILPNKGFQNPYKSSKTRLYYQELFEAFYILGADPALLQQSNEQKAIVQSKVYFKKLQEGLNNKMQMEKEIKENLILGYCYPFGNSAEKIVNQIDFDELDKLIYQGRTWDINEQFSTFSFRSNEDFLNAPPINIDFLDQYNPDRILYGMCLSLDDYVEINTENQGKKQKTFWKFKKTYTFLTHFPIQAIFKELLSQIVNIIKYVRITKLQSVVKSKESIYSDIDGLNITNDISDLLTLVIKQCQNQQLIKEDSSINFDINTTLQNTWLKNQLGLPKIVYKVPHLSQILIENRTVFSHLARQIFTFEEFVIILAGILSEGKIIFISENNNILSAIAQFFHGILLPFKWPHPFIYSIPEAIITFIDSPQPLICGVNKNYAYVVGRKAMLKSQDLMFVFVNQDKKTSNLIQFASKEYEAQLIKPRFRKYMQEISTYFRPYNQNKQITFNYSKEQQQQAEQLLKKVMFMIKTELMDIIPAFENDFVSEGKRLNNLLIETIIANKVTNTDDAKLIEVVSRTAYFQEYLKHLYIDK